MVNISNKPKINKIKNKMTNENIDKLNKLIQKT